MSTRPVARAGAAGPNPDRAGAGGRGWGRYAVVALATVVAATLANVAVYYLADVFVRYDPDFVILETVGPTITFTVVPAIVAALLYAVLLRRAADPPRTFRVIAAVVLVISVIPDLTYIPDEDGASGAQVAVLVLMHVVAAAVITGMLTTLARRP